MSLAAIGLLHVSMLLLLAVVSAMETAMHMARDPDAGQAARAGRSSRLDKDLRRIRQNPFVQLRRALVLSAALNLALALHSLFLAFGPLADLGFHPWASLAALLLLTVVGGDALPKLHAARRGGELLVSGSRLLRPVRRVVDPLASLADRAAEWLARRFLPGRRRVTMTRDEFETLVEMRQEQGLLGEEEAAMIREALDLDALIARDAIVPRGDLVMVDSHDATAEIEAALESADGRFVVVCRDSPDVVEGVVDTQAWRLAGRPDWRGLVRRAVFIPETKPLLAALEEHLDSSSAVVLVVDEYGGLEGLLSREEIADWLLHEAAPWLGEDAEIQEAGPGRFLLDGGARLDHIAEVTGVGLAPEEAEGIDTIGGLIFKLLGHVPKAGERLMIGGASLKVRRLVKARIKQVEMRVDPPPGREEAEREEAG